MAEIIDLTAILAERRAARQAQEDKELESLQAMVASWVEFLGEPEPEPYMVPLDLTFI